MSRMLIIFLSIALSGCSAIRKNLRDNKAGSKELRDSDLAEYLIGDWTLANTDLEFAQITFNKDGSYSYYAKEQSIEPRGLEGQEYSGSGIFAIKGNVCIETELKQNPQIRPLPFTTRYILESITPDSHTSRDENGGRAELYIRISKE